MEFEYDEELIREFAEELVGSPYIEPTPCERYQIAGIEWYALVYADCLMDDIAMGWDEARGDSPAWAELDNRQRHKVLATVAFYHESADQAFFDDEWTTRVSRVFEDDIAGDAESVIQ